MIKVGLASAALAVAPLASFDEPPQRWTAALAPSSASSGMTAPAYDSSESMNPALLFYSPPPVLPRQPGRLLRTEPVFAAWAPKRARAWRILYTTSDDGELRTASALVIVPDAPSGVSHAPPQVIAWAHGTTGIDRASAPSLDRVGPEAGAFYLSQQVIDQGWAVVATDYPGLGTPGPHKYLVGRVAAHAVLDALRAAYALRAVSPGGDIVVWGHSQGGQAALWTGIEAPIYAPELPIRGIAALAPPAELTATVHAFSAVTGGDVLAAYFIQGYSDAYGDVDFDRYVRPEARKRVHEMARHGLNTANTIGSAILDKIFDRPIWLDDPAIGPLGRRMQENTPIGTIPAPLLVAQGLTDRVVPAGATASYVRRMQAFGARVDFREFAGRDHVGLVKPDSPLVPELFDWTAQRFAHAGW